MAWRIEYDDIVLDLTAVTPGYTYYVDPTYGSDGNRGNRKTPLKTLTTGYALLRAGKNDLIRLVGGTSAASIGANLALNKNFAHLIGLGGEPRMNKRSRITMSTAFTPMITVSGYGSLIKDIYTAHGTAVGDLVGWSITGARNEFVNVHFGGPMNAAQAAAAGYIGVDVNPAAASGNETTFTNCVFGTDTIARLTNQNYNVQLEAGSLTIFEDCIFLAGLGSTVPSFVNVANTTGYTWAMFKRCLFMAMDPNNAVAMAAAFKISGGATAYIILDSGCQFINVTALAATAGELAYIWAPTLWPSQSAAGASIAVHP